MLPRRWLDGAHAAQVDGRTGLLVPGCGALGGADLHLSTAGALVVADGAELLLPWDGRARGTWWLAPWHASVRGTTGAAVASTDPELRDGLRTVRRAVRGVGPLPGWTRRLPVLAAEAPLETRPVTSLRSDRQRQRVDALCQALAGAPAVRARLDDSDAVELLAHDLRASRLGVRDDPLGPRRPTSDVLAALEGLGLRHRTGGRPLPWEPPLPPAQRVVDQVLQRGAVSPRPLDRDVVLAVVRTELTDVEPWPFAALVPPDRDGPVTMTTGTGPV